MNLFEKIMNRFGYQPKQAPTPHAEPVYAGEDVKKVPVERKAVLPSYYQFWKGRQREINVEELRTLAKTPTPRMCIRRLQNDVTSTQFEIIPLPREGEDKPDNKAKEHAKIIRRWFYDPNENHESFMSILALVTTDILELDSGVFLKEYARYAEKHYMTQLWAKDGGRFLKEADKYGVLGKPQNVNINGREYENYNVGYWQNAYMGTGDPIPFEPHEVIYIMQYPNTTQNLHGVYGTPPMQTVQLLVRTLMKGEEWYEEYFTEGATGSLAITTPTVFDTDADFEKWRKQIETGIVAKYTKKIYADNDAKFAPLGIPPEQVKWLETKDEYRHLVMANFNVTPEVLGFTKDIHKATAESQRDIYIKFGLKPLLDTIAYHVNMEIINEFFWKERKDAGVYSHGHSGKFSDSDVVDVAFRFKLYDPIGDARRLEVDEKRLKLGLTTVNRVLKREGQPPLKWGDINPLFMYNPQQWAQSLYFNAYGHDQLRDMTGIPKGKETLPRLPVPQPVTRAGEPMKAYKMSRRIRTIHKATVQPPLDMDTLTKDVRKIFTKRFAKQENAPEVPAIEDIRKALKVIITKLQTGQYTQEILDKWFKDMIELIVFEPTRDEVEAIKEQLKAYFKSAGLI